MPLSRITSGSIEDGTIATADLADNAVNSAKIGADVIVAEDLANKCHYHCKLQTVLLHKQN